MCNNNLENTNLLHMCLFREDEYWDFVESDFDKGIDKIKEKIQELGEGKYSWLLSLNDEILYIHLDIKEDRLEVRVFTSEQDAPLQNEIIRILKNNGNK